MFCFMRISLGLEVNKTVVACYVHGTNGERRGNWILAIKWLLMKACLGNPLRSKDTIEVSSFLCWKHAPIIMSCCFQNVLRWLWNALGLAECNWECLTWASLDMLLLCWIAKKGLLLEMVLGDATWGAEEGVLVFLPLLVGFKGAFLQAPFLLGWTGTFSLHV